MAAKSGVSTTHTIKPSSPTPDHLREFKISLLDQLAPPSIYVPIVLFYSASDISASELDFKRMSEKLKASLSDVLTLYYPFCGRLKGNFSVECNDDGVLYIESKVPTELSNILNDPQVHEIIELFPFDPYNPGVDHKECMAVQLNEFNCGGIGLGVCFSHKIADGATAGSFLNAWAGIARGHGNIVAPQMDAALVFPPRATGILDMTHGMVGHENIVTRRFIFNEESLSSLRDKLGCFNPTRVEAVTALIWKLAMEVTKVNSREHSTLQASMVTHAVNIRSRMNPPLSKRMLGNLWQQAISPIVEVDGEVRLLDLAEIVRRTIRKIDADYVRKLQGVGFAKVMESLKEARIMVAQKGIPCYSFSSWTRFGFYEADFGWGKPNWVCTIGVPIENVVILMATKDGGGIEAWVTLKKLDMAEFERNPELLQFTSLESSVFSGRE